MFSFPQVNINELTKLCDLFCSSINKSVRITKGRSELCIQQSLKRSFKVELSRSHTCGPMYYQVQTKPKFPSIFIPTFKLAIDMRQAHGFNVTVNSLCKVGLWMVCWGSLWCEIPSFASFGEYGGNKLGTLIRENICWHTPKHPNLFGQVLDGYFCSSLAERKHLNPQKQGGGCCL